MQSIAFITLCVSVKKAQTNLTLSVGEVKTMGFQNSPSLTNEQGQNQIKRYVHQPLTIEHYGIHAKIQENGKVLIQGAPEKNEAGDMEYDEVEIPASLVFKLASLLKATRSIQFVGVGEVKKAE